MSRVVPVSFMRDPVEERLWRTFSALKVPPSRVLALHVSRQEFDHIRRGMSPPLRRGEEVLFCGIPLKVKH